jgi:DNA polymerase-3 subunit delta
MSIESLRQDLKKDTLKNLYLFYGEETYLKNEYVKRVEENIVSKDLEGFNKVVLEENIDVMKLINACETMPVFADRKLVIVKKSKILSVEKFIQFREDLS